MSGLCSDQVKKYDSAQDLSLGALHSTVSSFLLWEFHCCSVDYMLIGYLQLIEESPRKREKHQHCAVIYLSRKQQGSIGRIVCKHKPKSSLDFVKGRIELRAIA